MARPRDLARPAAGAFLRELRNLASGADYPVVGQAAVRAWFHAHGWRKKNGDELTWDRLLDLQWRAGEPFGWHTPAIGMHRGQPVSTHLLLLRWAMVHGEKFGPPTTQHWVPALSSIRARRARASTRAALSRDRS
jgi:hypothetical protein